METIQALLETLEILWLRGNLWIRWAIIIFVLWPIAFLTGIALVAILGIPELTATLTLILTFLPILSILLFVVGTSILKYSLEELETAYAEDEITEEVFIRRRTAIQNRSFFSGLIALFITSKLGWRGLRVIAPLILLQLLIGLFLSVVPVWNDRGLLPLLLLAMASALFLILSKNVEARSRRLVGIGLATLMLGMTLMLVLGGRKETGEKIERIIRSVVTTAAAEPVRPAPTWPEDAASPSYPLCIPSDSVTFREGETQKTVIQHERCLSGWVITPPDAHLQYLITPSEKEGNWTEVHFIDGSVFGVVYGKPIHWQVRRGIFRLRGKGPVTVTLTR